MSNLQGNRMPTDYYNQQNGEYSNIKALNKWVGGQLITAAHLNAIEGKLDQIAQGLPDLIVASQSQDIPISAYNKLWITEPSEINFAEGHQFDSIRDLIASSLNNILSLFIPQFFNAFFIR